MLPRDRLPKALCSAPPKLGPRQLGGVGAPSAALPTSALWLQGMSRVSKMPGAFRKGCHSTAPPATELPVWCWGSNPEPQARPGLCFNRWILSGPQAAATGPLFTISTQCLQTPRTHHRWRETDRQTAVSAFSLPAPSLNIGLGTSCHPGTRGRIPRVTHTHK